MFFSVSNSEDEEQTFFFIKQFKVGPKAQTLQNTNEIKPKSYKIQFMVGLKAQALTILVPNKAHRILNNK
jgi:hypothetical protein